MEKERERERMSDQNRQRRQLILVGAWRGLDAHTGMKTSHTVQSRRLNALFVFFWTMPKRECEPGR